MSEIVFEVCAETMEACLAAYQGGASRIELCSALSEGGLTPSHGLIRQAIALCRLPIHGMVRPRGGGFVYSPVEFDIMRDDVLHAKHLGAVGVVLGLLQENGSVDVRRTRQLVEAAQPLEVTFHRAFDLTPSLSQALEDVISTGCKRVLTSGGEKDVNTGATALAELVAQAGGRIEIAAGGGLRIADARRLAKLTGVRHFHASMRQTGSEPDSAAWDAEEQVPGGDVTYTVHPEAIRAMIEHLQTPQ